MGSLKTPHGFFRLRVMAIAPQVWGMANVVS